jgi:uncharacterized repeat protein (TIGR01451 family)
MPQITSGSSMVLLPSFTDGTFTFDGQNWETGQAIWNNGCKIPPPPPTTQYGNLTITKTVVGAPADWSGTFTFSVSCSGYKTWTDLTITTGSSASYHLYDIPLGQDRTRSCTVTETNAGDVPGAGYSAWSTSYSTDGGVVTVKTDSGTETVTNTTTPPTISPTTYCIDISKVNGSEQALAGAVFTVKQDGTLVDVTGNPVTTNSDGNASLCGLAAGTYTVVETTPPSGYTGAADQTVTLPQTSEVTTLTFVDTLIPPPPPTTYCISVSKVDVAGASLVATFWLNNAANPNGEPLILATPHDPICGLAAGTYVVTEEIPPTGYTGAAPQTVTLPVDNATGNGSLTFVDTLIPPPPPVCTVGCNPPVILTPALTVTKFVSLSQSGPFTSHSVATAVGTTVWYQVTMTNTGQEALSGVTFSDSLGLPSSCSSVPTTLSVGASFSCTYSRPATLGTTGNTATGTSSQIGPRSDTATVIGTAVPVAPQTPTGGVAGATGRPHITPPPTSALGSVPAQPAGDTWRIALLGLAALLASLLVFIPKTSPERRHR